MLSGSRLDLPCRCHRSSLLSQSLYAILPGNILEQTPQAESVFFNFLADATQLGPIARHQSSASESLHIVKGKFPRKLELVSKRLWYRHRERDKSVIDHRFLMRFTGPVQWVGSFVGNTSPIIGPYNLPALVLYTIRFALWPQLPLFPSLHYVHDWLLHHQRVAVSRPN
jgi:hypothetical protein